MSVLSGFAKGFLSLLDSNNFGAQPRQLAEFVQPVIEMADLYLLQKQRNMFAGTAGNIAAGFNSCSIVVPDGEVWKLLAFSVSLIPAAGASGIFSASMLVDGAAVQLHDSQPYVASTRIWQAAIGLPIWLTSGATIGVTAQAVVGATPASAQIIFAQLRA